MYAKNIVTNIYIFLFAVWKVVAKEIGWAAWREISVFWLELKLEEKKKKKKTC